MDKREEIILKESLNETEFYLIKNNKNIKYSIAIITSTLIIAAVIILSIGYFKVEVIEEVTKPVVRNLGFATTVSKTYNLGSFKIDKQTISIKYVVSMTKTQCQNKIVITSKLGTFEFGNTGMSSPGKGSKSYNTPIFKFAAPAFVSQTITAYVKGSFSWDVSLISNNKYNIELSGKLVLFGEYHTPSPKIHIPDYYRASCVISGTLSDAKGKLIVSNGSITKDSDFSLGMGGLEIECDRGGFKIERKKFPLFKEWRYI